MKGLETGRRCPPYLFALFTASLFAIAGLMIHDYRTDRDAFFMAIMADDLSEVKRLLDKRPSLIASQSLHLQVPGNITMLVSRCSPLFAAVMYQSRDAFDLFIDQSIDLNDGGPGNSPPLVHAVALDDIYFLKTLIDHGASTSLRDEHGKTAEEWARKFDKTEFIELLTEPTPDV